MNLFQLIADLAALSAEELSAYIEELSGRIAEVTSAPAEFVSEDRTSSAVIAETQEAVASLRAAREQLASLEPEVVEPTAEELAAQMATLAAEADVDDEAEETEAVAEVEEDEVEDEEIAAVEETEPVAEAEPVVAAAPPARARTTRKPTRGALPAPGRDRRPAESTSREVSLTAASGAPDMDPGESFPSMDSISQAMISRRRTFGVIAPGTSEERIPIARADWGHDYPEERRLGGDEVRNHALVAAVTNQAAIKREFAERRAKSMTAAGGICAPVTPYYGLQMLSTAGRPVRAALAAFNADRGGIRYARPAALTVIDDGIGVITAAQDLAGGPDGTKVCQVVDCPPFEETDVNSIFHCLQFGNLGARTFPERVTQWNQLILAAHARLAESTLLTGIDTASKEVAAANLGLGAVASYLSTVVTAASAYRNRHRMDRDAVLRLMLPAWGIDLLISDTIRSQFDRFDTDEARLTTLLRRFNLEPTFYIDSAAGRGQIQGAQADNSTLNEFPSTLVSYLYAEGSFLYLDGGTLELGLVRDSVLNSTNEYQIFGETFENVAFTGIESIALIADVCDSGAVSAPVEVDCPIQYDATP